MISSEIGNRFMGGLYKLVEAFTGKPLELPFKEIEYHADINETLKGLADNFEVMAKAVEEDSARKINIEDIKALDSGKIYVIAVDFNAPTAADWCEELIKTMDRLDLIFIVIPKGVMEMIPVPEGYEVSQKKNKVGPCDIRKY